mmetsp:Transcript_19390/g.54447  ORF Transcript_19390/g.54447 Transcript_19390/m.54447 type:complete len:1803 (+) Transcript_19390:150-5558(+)|eukprot:CAMPEP_0119158210 /NCGR_PEP_ID=MMETSP1310-20130426/53146_1 /TAXON_ID=464262 /ORGANISM="Genus nov. species nov., Strain RCC2339" /LENGTH=1802 /DNA_ID=CAMNT_0007150835 /DNA_START=28 /DNA_END=5436 /DNA_ORIENTATION=+
MKTVVCLGIILMLLLLSKDVNGRADSWSTFRGQNFSSIASPVETIVNFPVGYLTAGHASFNTQVQLHYDEDLVVQEDIYCTDLQLALREWTCNPCDYSGPTNAGGLCATTVPHIMGLPGQPNGLPDCECDIRYCTGQELVVDDVPRSFRFSGDPFATFKFKHSSPDTGFLVRWTGETAQPIQVAVSRSPPLSDGGGIRGQGNLLSLSTRNSPVFSALGCPSHAHFGPEAGSVNYYITVESPTNLPVIALEISVETVPTLVLATSGMALSTFTSEGGVSNSIFSSPLEVDSGVYIPGNHYGSLLPGGSNSFALLYPLDSCELLSLNIHAAPTEGRDAPDFPYLHAGVITESVKAAATSWSGGQLLSPAISASLLVSGFPLQTGTGGTVLSACPTSVVEQSYFVVLLDSEQNTFWEAEVLVRNAASSPYLSSTLIGDLATPQAQSILRNSFYLGCTCNEECDHCSIRQGEVVSQFSADSVDYRLLSLLEEVRFHADIRNGGFFRNWFPNCSLSSELGIPVQDNLIFRCNDLQRDGACKLLRVIQQREYANPIMFPTPDLLDYLGIWRPEETEEVEIGIRKKSNSVGLLVNNIVHDISLFSYDSLFRCGIAASNPNVLHTESGRSLSPAIVPLANANIESERSCVQSNFTSMRKSIESFGDAIVDPTKADRVGDNYFAANSLTFSDDWGACMEYGLSLTEFVKITRDYPLDTLFCVPGQYNASNPCCSKEAQWGSCCSPYIINVQDMEIPGKERTNLLVSDCENELCAIQMQYEFRLSYYITVAELNCIILDPKVGLDEVVRGCTEFAFGSIPGGARCTSDDTCTQRYGEGGFCNLKTNRCNNVTSGMEYRFVWCILTFSTPFFRTGILSVAGTLDASELLSTLQDYDCNAPEGPMGVYHSHYELRTFDAEAYQTCPSCYENVYCVLGIECSLPAQCMSHRPGCTPRLQLVQSPECILDEVPEVCNWDNSISDSEACGNEFHCMYCHNDQDCVILQATTEEECLALDVCVFPNGTVAADISEESCGEFEGCTESSCMGGAPANSRLECSYKCGVCEGVDNIESGVQAAIQKYPNLAGIEGVCLHPLHPYNEPDCSFLTDPTNGVTADFSTSQGCVFFSTCTPTFALSGGGSQARRRATDCFPSEFADRTFCEASGGKWLSLPLDRASCGDQSKLDDNEVFCQTVLDFQPLAAPADRDDCLACDGTPQRQAVFRGGSWVSGTFRRPVWQPARTVPLATREMSLSMPLLNDFLERVVANLTASLAYVSHVCLQRSFATPLEGLSCFCGEGDGDGQLCNELTRQGGEVLPVQTLGEFYICPDFPTLSAFQDLRLRSGHTPDEYIAGDVCTVTQYQLATKSVFLTNRQRVPRLIFGDPNTLDPFPVRNFKGASVGVVLGNGLVLKRSSSFGERPRRVELSFFLNISEVSSTPAQFNRVDFAIEVLDPLEKYHPDEIELRPLDATGFTVGLSREEFLAFPYTEEQDGFYAVGIWQSPDIDRSPRIFPVMVMDDWVNVETEDLLSSGEKAMLITFSILYFAVSLYALVMFAFGLWLSFAVATAVICILCFSALVLRGVYLALFAAGHLHGDTAWTYILVEAPIFLYLSVMTVLIMALSYTLQSTSQSASSSRSSKAWLLWGAVQLVLVCFYVVVVTLLSELGDGDAVLSTCLGRITSLEEDRTVDYVRIAYYSVIFILSVVASIVLLGLTLRIYSIIRKNQFALVTIFCSFMITLYASMWVLYSALDGSTPYYVIPLFILEGSLAVVIVTATRPTQIRRRIRVRQSGSSNSNALRRNAASSSGNTSGSSKM